MNHDWLAGCMLNSSELRKWRRTGEGVGWWVGGLCQVVENSSEVRVLTGQE